MLQNTLELILKVGAEQRGKGLLLLRFENNFISSAARNRLDARMSLQGYTEYKAREFCKDEKCPVEETLNSLVNSPESYELIRQTCRTACRFSTWQFHHWLIEKGYLIIKKE
jgi:hypothetical protein